MDIITIRASSLPELFDCSARWEAKHINGYRMPSSSNSVLGKAVHAGTAIYDQQILDGDPISVDDASGIVVDTIHKPNEDVEWGDDSPKVTEGIAVALHKLYCNDIAPLQTYFAVEALCESLIIDDLGLAITGTLDRIHVINDEKGITDIKSGAQAVGADGKVKTQGHGAQVCKEQHTRSEIIPLRLFPKLQHEWNRL